MPVFELQDVHKIYGTSRAKVHTLKRIELAVHRSDLILIVGSSGKTTLLNIIGCNGLPISGKVLLEGHEIRTALTVKF